MDSLIKEEIKDKIHEDVDKWRKDKIIELEEKKDLSETEKSFLDFLKKNDINTQLREIFFEILEVLDYYMDDTSENMVIYAIWIIGTYFHNQFQSYPYLFLNAMRGSGKSRLLKLISVLGAGKYTSSITEPIIFRTKGLICIDELESIGSKDKTSLRELLNASYKKGMTIMRVIKKKGIGGDNMLIEEFECYRPVAMANIWGMEEVLGDRCISRILEKSNNEVKTKRNENFETNPQIQHIRNKLFQCSWCSVDVKKNVELWNKFIDTIHLYTNYSNYYNYSNYIFNQQELDFYNKINNTGIFGRNLELFLPLFVISNIIGIDILDNTLNIAKKFNNEKKDNEIMESIDVLVYNYISMQPTSLNFISIRELFQGFKQYSQIEQEWVNDKWFGKALKRLNLTLEKRRMGAGIEVILNVIKAKEKLKIFQNTKLND